MEMAQQQMSVTPGAQRQIGAGLVTIFLTYLVYTYFYQILLSALPKIAADLDGMHLYSWGVSIPNLGLAFSMLMVGKLSDLYGRRALLLLSLAVCLLGAIWCALSSTFVMLIIARTVLCIGQGGLAPLCFSALGGYVRTCPAQQMGRPSQHTGRKLRLHRTYPGRMVCGQS